MPFWLRSNQFGSVPLDKASLSLIGAIRKDYDTSKTRIPDWGASVEGRANMGHKSNFTIIEGYGKLRISVFEIRAGRSLGTIRFPPMYGLFNETNAIFSISGCKQRIKKRAECRIYRGGGCWGVVL